MAEISYRRHRFPPAIIQHAVWLYLRFTLSYRDVEELLAERGLDISYETVRCWVLKFGPVIARRYAGAVRGRAIAGTSTKYRKGRAIGCSGLEAADKRR
jgi:transposase-like protein